MKFIDKANYLNYGENSINDELFNEKMEEYNNYFDSIVKPRLSKNFLSKYIKFHGFHDWQLISIEKNTQTRDKYISDVVVTIFCSLKNTTKKICYSKVNLFKADFNYNHFERWSYDDYGVDEFLILENGFLSHEVNFPSGSSYYIEFKTIKIL